MESFFVGDYILLGKNQYNRMGCWLSILLQNDSAGSEYLIGWDEIRYALKRVEDARQQGQDAKIEITNANKDTILRITLRSVDELERYFKSDLRRLILGGRKEDSSSVWGKIILQ